MTGRPDEAEGHLREAIRLEPAFAEAHNSLGIVLARLGRIDEAVDQFKAALALRPDYQDARNNLDRALRARSRP